MARFIGENAADSVKVPCTGPSTDDVFLIDTGSSTTASWGKVGGPNAGKGAFDSYHLHPKLNFHSAPGSMLLVDAVDGSGPSGLQMFGAAVWNTDVLRSTSVHYSGDSSIKIVGAASTGKGVATSMIPVRERDVVSASVAWQCSTATGKLNAYCQFYQADQVSTVGAPMTMVNAVNVKGASAWESNTATATVPAAGRWAQLVFQKNLTDSGDLYIDSYAFSAAPQASVTMTIQVPIGTILAWTTHIPGTPSALPTGFLACDGSLIGDTESPMYNQHVPNLNTTGTSPYFLGGYSASSATLVPSNLPTHTHNWTYYTSTASGVGFTSTAQTTSGSLSHPMTQGINGPPTGTGIDGTTKNYPQHMKVIWIMRIK